jgi:hypothetical protein
VHADERGRSSREVLISNDFRKMMPTYTTSSLLYPTISRQTPSKAVMIFRVVCPFAGAERCCNAIWMEAVRGCKRVMALLETD